jgi:hypothetical protein
MRAGEKNIQLPSRFGRVPRTAPQFAEVADLAIEVDPVPRGRVLHRLVPEGRAINDGEASVGKAYLARLGRAAVNDDRAGVIRTAMNQRTLRSYKETLLDSSALCDDSKNPTHIDWLPSRLAGSMKEL